MDKSFVVRAALLGGAMLFTAWPGATQQPANVALLARLEPGQWELRGPTNSRIALYCLGNPLQLIQPQHGTTACTRTLISEDARQATVQYSCPGAGNGRTTVRFETSRLVQIDSQGMDHGAPFALRGEARHLGPC
jgi:hypothetical protein